MFPVYTVAGRWRGTLAPGTPVPPHAGTMFLRWPRPARFFRGEGAPPHGFWRDHSPDFAPEPKKRRASSLCGPLGNAVWQCPAQSPEVRANWHARREAVAAHHNGRGPAPAPPVPLGAGPPPALVASSTFSDAANRSGARAFVHAVKTSDRAYPDGGEDAEGSYSEKWAAGPPGASLAGGDLSHAWVDV